MALGILLLCKHICQRLCFLVSILVGGSLYEKQLQFLSAFRLGANEWGGGSCVGGRLRVELCTVCLLICECDFLPVPDSSFAATP